IGVHFLHERALHVPDASPIFACYADAGCSLFGLAKKLHKEGVAAPRGWGRWNVTTLRRILTNPVYTGAVRPELPDAHHTWGLAAEGPIRKECFTERRPHSPGCRYTAARRSNPTCRAPGTMG